MGLLLGIFASFAAVTNCKLPMVPLGTIAIAALAAVLLARRSKLKKLRIQMARSSRPLLLAYSAALLFLFGLAYYKPVENWLEFANPLYPVAIKVGPVNLPGTLDSGGTTPDYLRGLPKPLVWTLSVLEYNAFDSRVPLWTNGQGDLKWTSPAFRMGGYFGAFVLLNLFCIAAAWESPDVWMGRPPTAFLRTSPDGSVLHPR